MTTITVSAATVVSLTPLPNVCQTDAPVNLPPMQSGVQGTWSGSGVSGNTFNPLITGPGTFPLTFTPNPGQCASVNMTTITVSAATVVSLTPLPSVCQTDAPVNLPPMQSGIQGNWSGSGVSGNAFNPLITGPGTFSLTFTPNPGQCVSLNTTSIVVQQALNNPVINTICDDSGTPSDPGDDTFTYTVEVVGDPASTYSISDGDTQNGLTYNQVQGPFGPFLIQGGSFLITLTDDLVSSCQLGDVLVLAPAPCSNTCNLTATGLSDLTCNDNGTASNVMDDFVTFSLDPAGLNLGATYTVSVSSGSITPTTANYGQVTNFQLQTGSAGAGAVTITITDDSDAGCTFQTTITDPGPCSNTCNLTGAGLNDLTCNDNATPSEAGDDFVTFSLNPAGTNLGPTYTVSVSSGTITPLIGNYGQVTNFQLQSGSAGSGAVTITITDDSDAGCTFQTTITDPGPCSNTCNLTGADLTDLTCNDNATPSDAGDDFVTFSLNPAGTNLGATYTVSVSSGTITPTTANYGQVTNFQLQSGSTGSGDVTITITDDTDSGCTFQTTITDPGPCSNTCNLTGAGLTDLTCNDNVTSSDAGDDFLTFSLDPAGLNLGANYTVSVSSGTITPITANYGQPTNFQLQAGSAGAGAVTITITDDSDADCTFQTTITDPGPCSNTCNLTGAGLTDLTCNDNATPSDAGDDFVTFSLNPAGSNLGATYTVSVSSGTITPITANYGQVTNFQLQSGSAGSGDVTITITDDSDAGCTFQTTITDPGPCSNTCNLTGAGLTDLTCNDNATPSEVGDDFLTFSLNPAGTNLGATYTVSVSSGTITPTTASYGQVTNFQLQSGSAGAGDVTITVTDDTDSGCTFQATVTDPGPCSNTCNLTGADLTDLTCNDNATPSEADDDFVTFSLNPAGTNLGATYTVSVSSVTITPTTANYGQPTNFQLQAGSAGAGDVTITITDDSDAGCTFQTTVTDPGPCSNTCNLTGAGLTDLTCNDNATPSEAGDDFVTFSLNPAGSNLGSTYTVSASSGTITPLIGNYGQPTNFQLQAGSAGAGAVTITITDDSDAGCTFQTTITDPGPCSNTCNLTGASLTDLTCNDNATPSDAGDDFLTFSLNPAGTNLGATYTVSVSSGSITPTTANYGQVTNFQLQSGSAGAGDVTITVTDDPDSGCTFQTTVTDPGPCSNTCNLTGAGLTDLTCNDNATPSEAGDDFVTFSLNPAGSNLGPTYTVSVSSGTITPITANYGQVTNFQLQAGSAGSGDVTITITDDSDSGCTFQTTITDPGSCSNTCNLADAGLEGLLCNDNNTPFNDTDDFFTFTLNPEGSNLGASYTVSTSAGSVTPGTGLYGVNTSFELLLGSTYPELIVITIVDSGDPGCSVETTLVDLEPCSGTCALNASIIVSQQIECPKSSGALETAVTGSNGVLSYDWNLDELDGQNNTTGLSSGIYQLTVTDEFGCSDSVEIELTAPAPIELGLEVSAPPCQGDLLGNIEVLGITGGTPNYVYAINGMPFGANSSFSNLISGEEYLISVQDANGCTADTIAYLPEATPLTVDLGPDTTILLEDIIQLEALTNISTDQIDSVFWRTAAEISCTDDQCLAIFIGPRNSLTVEVMVIDHNGCIATDEIVISVDRNLKVYVPNVFSPNGDGHNDTFNVYAGAQVRIVKSFSVFSRWGEEVFLATNLPPNEELGWDGTYEQQPLNSGVYVWMAEVELMDGTIELLKGDVTLLR